MELDEYKAIVRQSRKEFAFIEPGVMPRRNTHSVVHRIKKSLHAEIAFSLLFIIFITYILFKTENNYLQLFAWSLICFCLCFMYYLIMLRRKINFYQSSIFTLKEGLRQLISIVVQFTRLYFQLTMIMVPVIIALTFLSVYAGNSLIMGDFLSFSKERILIFSGLSAAWWIAMYFFTKWYIKKLYGDYLLTLKLHLKELEEDNN